MKIKLLLVPIVAFGGLLGISSAVRAAPAPPLQTFTVRVGDAVGQNLANQFLPQTITIHKGDSIHFATGGDLHTATYLPPNMDDPPVVIENPVGPGVVFNPVVNDPTNPSTSPTEFDPGKYYNSGTMFPGQSSDVRFDVVGSWTFLCHFHRGMRLGVSVTADPADVPSQADLDAKADAQRDAIVANDNDYAAQVQLKKTTAAGGAATWELQAGAGGNDDVADVLQFLPAAPLKITTGDTVHWKSGSSTPHTVTFLNGAAFPDITVNIQNPGHPPLLVGFGPLAVLPVGPSTQDGTAYTNSGFFSKDGGFPGGTNFSQTFTKAGTYTYICMLHEGMGGVISVSDPAPVAPPVRPIAPPDTGSGPQAGDRGAWLVPLIALAIVGVTLLGSGALAALKRRA